MFYSVICEDCNTNAECIMGKCVCKNGYIGNGTSCLQKKGQQILCISGILEKNILLG